MEESVYRLKVRTKTEAHEFFGVPCRDMDRIIRSLSGEPLSCLSLDLSGKGLWVPMNEIVSIAWEVEPDAD